MPNLQIATFNLKSDLLCLGAHAWAKRRELILRMLRELNADITGVQELTPRMRSDLSRELTDCTLVGRGRCRNFLNEHADIVVRNGLRVLSESTFWLSKKPDRVSSLIAPRYPLSWIFPRICTTAEVTLPEGQRIRVFNTHLDVLSEGLRRWQLTFICRRISQYQESDPLPTLLMGDFNASPKARSIQSLENGYGFPGVRLRCITADTDGGTYHHFHGGEGIRRLDYIFASEEFSLIDAQVIRSCYDGRYPSDHYPLLALLKLST
ncbi:MAG: endonuclease/exonuclease/phosphatase family protein [Clostridia bacterium]|nr:endonuclease/exonuclease/phosphatase family protein [Clostridia bacterium]